MNDKELSRSNFGKKIRHFWENKRGSKKKLTLSEVVTLNLLRFYMRIQDLKTFHRVAKEIAGSGKTSKEWFFGFKLHGACNRDGELENIFFSPGNVKDNKALDKLIVNLEGILVCDAGYLLKENDLEPSFESEKKLYIATRVNMKRLMSKSQHELFRKRSVIESVWNTLKERMNMVYSFARGVHGLFRHYLYCICSYMLTGFFRKVKRDLLSEASYLLV